MQFVQPKLFAMMIWFYDRLVHKKKTHGAMLKINFDSLFYFLCFTCFFCVRWSFLFSLLYLLFFCKRKVRACTIAAIFCFINGSFKHNSLLKFDTFSLNIPWANRFCCKFSASIWKVKRNLTSMKFVVMNLRRQEQF